MQPRTWNRPCPRLTIITGTSAVHTAVARDRGCTSNSQDTSLPNVSATEAFPSPSRPLDIGMALDRDAVSGPINQTGSQEAAPPRIVKRPRAQDTCETAEAAALPPPRHIC